MKDEGVNNNSISTVTINGESKQYPISTTYMEIAKEYQNNFSSDIVLVLEDNKLQELFKTVKDSSKIAFITTKDAAGYSAYQRSAVLLFLKSFYDTVENIDKIKVDFSISSGLFCRVTGDFTLDEELLAKVKERMLALVERKIPIKKRTVGTDDAMELFHQHGMYDKEKLFQYRRVSKANIYSLSGFEDYYYGYMLPDTGYLKYFELYLYDNGVVIQFPKKNDPTVTPPFYPPKKLFEVLKESSSWSDLLGVDTVGALNDKMISGEIKDIILAEEALQETKIGEIAKTIAAQKDKKFIMIAGPSSSGKTTFSHRLSIQLFAHGLKPHPIGVDDYFLDRDHTPIDEFGNRDFESLGAIDVEQFNKDMTALLAGEKVELPSFNFKTGMREYKGNYKQLGENDVLVIEGIHCLNDKLSYTLPKESKFKIYISALTQLNVDEHNRIRTTDGRLIRRLVRDARTRGMSAKQTISMWDSVRRGEEVNIFPFQEEADVMFNSALNYELAVLKQYAEPLLFSINKNEPEYIEAKRLLKFLDYFLGISSEGLPNNSIIREFIGGSCFNV